MLESTVEATTKKTQFLFQYRNYVLMILVSVGVFAWVDRQIFAMLMQSIKEEFAFSDTQLGLLGGLAFSVLNVTVGLPVAWLGDRFNRRNIISIALGLWSGMTALCGLATGFATLFLARAGVGVGEACGGPSSQSLVSDYFPPEKRGFAMGILFLSLPIGFIIGYLVGGWVNELTDWRTVFFIVGIPGIIVAILIRLTVKEMPRGASENRLSDPNSVSMIKTIRYFLSRNSLRHLPLAGAIHGIGAFGVSIWAPAFFIRVHEMSSGEVGTWLALTYGLGGGLGMTIGGKLADRLFQRTGDVNQYMKVAVFSLLISAPFMIPVFTLNNPVPAFFSFLIALFFGHMFVGPIMAMIQALAGVNRRTQVAAYYFFLANLISMSLGPLIIGVISDRFDESFGALRYSILSLSIVTIIWASLHFYLASRTLKTDLEKADFNPNSVS
jgi:MFS family permease